MSGESEKKKGETVPLCVFSQELVERGDQARPPVILELRLDELHQHLVLFRQLQSPKPLAFGQDLEIVICREHILPLFRRRHAELLRQPQPSPSEKLLIVLIFGESLPQPVAAIATLEVVISNLLQ